jgi:hypothetical protein
MLLPRRSSVQEGFYPSLPFRHLPLVGVKVKEMPHSVHQSPQPESLQYWQVNVLPGQRTKQCPEYLLGQPEKNQRILSTPDEDYCRQTWPEVQEIVSQWHRPLTNNAIFTDVMLIRGLYRNKYDPPLPTRT